MTNKIKKFAIEYPGSSFELLDEVELSKVKNAVNAGYAHVDLVRGKERIKVNLTNYISIKS